MAYIFLVPNKIISGASALETAMDSIVSFGRKPLIVTDPAMIRFGNLEKLTALLESRNVPYAVYSDVDREPDDLLIGAGVEAYRAGGCDYLIAMGGGSAIDSMKAIGMMAHSDRPIASYMGRPVSVEMPKMAAIPTTAGTGSEATKFTIINDTGTQVKMLLTGECLIPDLAVIDPQFTMTVPARVTAATGIDALCHCTEAFTSKKAQPLSDTFALSAAKRIFANLRTCYREPGNVEARIQMSLAATEAGIAFNNSSVTIVHGMSRPIGALFHIAHGMSNAILLEGCMKFAVDGAYGRFAELSRALGFATAGDDDRTAAMNFLAEESKLLRDLDTPSMSELGIDRDRYFPLVEKMAKDAFASGSPSNTIKEVTVEDMMKLYQEMYR